MRLRRRAEYLDVQTTGRKVQGTHLLLLFRVGEATKVGITVSSRVGNAVERNRIKRWLRELVRRKKGEFPAGRLVIIAKESAARVPHAAIDDEVIRLLRRLRGKAA